VGAALAHAPRASADPGRWSADRANSWYQAQGWLVGANYITSTAINQLEMWQAETWDPTTIDRLSGYFASLLGAAMAEAEQPVANLPLLTGAE